MWFISLPWSGIEHNVEFKSEAILEVFSSVALTEKKWYQWLPVNYGAGTKRYYQLSIKKTSSLQSSIRKPTWSTLCVCLLCAEIKFIKAVVNSMLNIDVFDQFSSYCI